MCGSRRAALLACVLLLSTCSASEDQHLRVLSYQYQGLRVTMRKPSAPRQPGAGGPIVLLLHGAKFTSDTWVQLGTLDMLHRHGFNSFALDLPGFGQTPRMPSNTVDELARAQFIKAALEFAAEGQDLTQTGAIIVSPSMSARWAAPFADMYGTLLRGWAGVAPAGIIQAILSEQARKVPMMLMYGDQDPMKVQIDTIYDMFDSVRPIIIPRAGHACYLDQPEAFHMHLLAFVRDCLNLFKRP